MMTDSNFTITQCPSNTELYDEHGGSVFGILMIVFFVTFVIFIIILLIFNYFKSKRKIQKETSDAFSDTGKFLIPPIFYTKNVKDPLFQEDLSEHALQKLNLEQKK